MGLNSNLLGCPEHGAPAESPCKRVVSTGGVVDSDTTRKIHHVDGVAVWLMLETAGEAANKPGGGGAKDREPKHLDVGVLNGIAMALNQRVFPRNDVNDCFFGGVAGMHGVSCC
jgi:hypothetical protein